jgi:hypothetical protein
MDKRTLTALPTLGASGTMPPFTSKHWPESGVTVMRGNWTENSPYLFTNVRGGGAHGHADDKKQSKILMPQPYLTALKKLKPLFGIPPKEPYLCIRNAPKKPLAYCEWSDCRQMRYRKCDFLIPH